MKNITILGSTGSIGTNALEVIRNKRDEFNVIAMSGHGNYKLLLEQIEEFSPKYVSIGQAITRQEQLGPDGFLLDPRHTAIPVSLSTVGRIWEIGADAIEDGEVPYRFLNYTPIVGRNPLSQGLIDYTVEQND